MAEIIVPLAALAATGLLVLLVYALGLRGQDRLITDDALLPLCADGGGAREWLIGCDGLAALVLLGTGDYLAARVLGDRITTRRFAAPAISTITLGPPGPANGCRIDIRFKEMAFPRLRLWLADDILPTWVDDLRARVEKT